MSSMTAVRSAVRTLILLMVGAGAIATPRALGEPKAPMARSGVEMQFFDPRIPADERQVLETTVGYALPPLSDGAVWVGDHAIDLGALRGQVVVIQSFTRADADGRAAFRRTPEIVANMGLEGVVVIGLHTPEGADESAGFFEKKPPETPVILDRTGAFCDELGVYKRPVTMLIDRRGRIRYPGVAMSKLRAALDLLAAEKIDASMVVPETLPPRATRLNEQAGGGGGDPANAAAQRPPFPAIRGDGGSARDVRGKPGPALDRLRYVTDAPTLEDRVILVEFWATWCGPCVANIPHLNELNAKFSDRVAIIGVSKEEEAKVKGFVKSKGMQYAVAVDQGGTINNRLSVRAIPFAIIMSPDRIVRWQGHPAALEENILQQIIDASGVGEGGAPNTPKRWITTPT